MTRQSRGLKFLRTFPLILGAKLQKKLYICTNNLLNY